MKLTFLYIDKEKIFPKLVRYLGYGLNMRMSQIFSVDQYIIKIYNNKNIKLFSQNLVDIFLENDRSIKEAKGYDLIFKMRVLDQKISLLLITFTNPYLIIGVHQVQLDEPPSPAKSIQQFTNQR